MQPLSESTIKKTKRFVGVTMYWTHAYLTPHETHLNSRYLRLYVHLVIGRVPRFPRARSPLCGSTGPGQVTIFDVPRPDEAVMKRISILVLCLMHI